jgi:YVTN family beta-propeller protein
MAFALAAALVLVVVATVVAARRDAPTPVALAGNSVAVIDPATNSAVAEIPLGARPSGIAVGEGSVWVGNRDDHTLLRIDPSSREVARTIGLSVEPTEVSVGAGSVWVASKPANAVLRVDPDVDDVVATITLPEGSGVCCPPEIAVGERAVWVSHFGALSRIDPATNAVTTNRAANVSAVAYGDHSFWVLTGTEADVIGRIDPRTGAVVDSISLKSVGRPGGAGWVAAGESAVWTATHYSETLWKLDPLGGRITASVPLGRRVGGVAAGDGAVWVAGTDGTLLRIDPESASVVKTIPLGVFPAYLWGSVAVGERAVWVAADRL